MVTEKRARFKFELFEYLQLRLPAKVNEDVQEDPSGTKQLWERGNLNGASQKVR